MDSNPVLWCGKATIGTGTKVKSWQLFNDCINIIDDNEGRIVEVVRKTPQMWFNITLPDCLRITLGGGSVTLFHLLGETPHNFLRHICNAWSINAADILRQLVSEPAVSATTIPPPVARQPPASSPASLSSFPPPAPKSEEEVALAKIWARQDVAIGDVVKHTRDVMGGIVKRGDEMDAMHYTTEKEVVDVEALVVDIKKELKKCEVAVNEKINDHFTVTNARREHIRDLAAQKTAGEHKLAKKVQKEELLIIEAQKAARKYAELEAAEVYKEELKRTMALGGLKPRGTD